MNSKATLLFSGMIDNAIHENIFLSDLSYLTDEHGGKLNVNQSFPPFSKEFPWILPFFFFKCLCCILSDIYFEVNLDEDLLQTLTADEKLVV